MIRFLFVWNSDKLASKNEWKTINSTECMSWLDTLREFCFQSESMENVLPPFASAYFKTRNIIISFLLNEISLRKN